MDNLVLEGTLKTLDINFDANKGTLAIKGRSIPENSFDFFDPIFKWLNEYFEAPKAETKIDLYIEYFNTASSKCLLDIFRIIEKNASSTDINITWHYEEEDEDMEYAGEDFKAVLNLPFKLNSVESF